MLFIYLPLLLILFNEQFSHRNVISFLQKLMLQVVFEVVCVTFWYSQLIWLQILYLLLDVTFWEIIWRKSFCKNLAEDEVSGWWSQFFPQKISFQWKKGLTVVAFTAFPSLAPILVSPASSSVESNLLASYFESGPHFLIFRCYKIRGKGIGNFFRTKHGFFPKAQ